MRTILPALFVFFTSCVFSQDTIVVSIAHGSKPLKQFPQEHRTIGGIKGGHVVIEIDGFAYGFFFKGDRIHIFPHRRSPNGIFQKQTVKEWKEITKDKKVTDVFIPVTEEEKLQLIKFYTDNLKKPSYDYSFFGQRCASSVYRLLGSIHKMESGSYILNAFYPGQLRKTIVKQNNENKYRILVKAGSIKRKWEGD